MALCKKVARSKSDLSVEKNLEQQERLKKKDSGFFMHNFQQLNGFVGWLLPDFKKGKAKCFLYGLLFNTPKGLENMRKVYY